MLASGFLHVARFSAYYRHLFGEPSAQMTLGDSLLYMKAG
jgi:hypothetical protein